MREHTEGTEHILADLLPARAPGPDPLPRTVARTTVQRLGGDLALDPLAEDLDRDRGPRRGERGRQVGVGDRAADRVAVAAGRHPADDLAVHPHRLVAERDRPRVVQGDAGELLP